MSDRPPDRPTLSPRFIFHPDWQEMPQPQRVFRGLAQLLGVGFLGSIIAWQLFGALSEAAGYENVLEAELAQWTMIEQLILVVVLAPVLEETIYRLPLQSTYRPGFLALAFVIGVVFFAGPYSFLFWTGIVLACASGVTALNPELKARVQRLWSVNPRILIYASTLTFGLIHIVNFEVQWSIAALLVAPLAVSPQIWLGLMFTIARVRYGWWAALVLHATHNGLIWSIGSLAG